LALDEPYLVSGLLLLDPTPPNPTLLKGMGVFLRLSAPLGPIGQRLWERRARRDLRGVAMDADQARAFEVYTARGFLAETARWGRHLARDGATLAGDLTTGQAPSIPTIVVSAGYHRPKSSIRRAHEQLVARMRGAELQVWAGARHPLHIQHPTRVTNLVLSLLDRTQKVERASG
jgi:pimeloyl-ACP methyl ester carboxylesterase